MSAYMIQDGLYHVETGIPWHLFGPFAGKSFGLDYGQHARREALNDKYGPLTSVPLSHKFTRTEIFEVEVEQGRIVKFAARLNSGFSLASCHIDKDYWKGRIDLVLVCVPSLRDSNSLFVKTLWLNERADGHGTLDKSKYIPY